MSKAKSKHARAASDTSDSDEGVEDREPPPKKFAKDTKDGKKPKSKARDSDEEESSFALSRTRFVKVREFHGKLMVDIREFYEKDGEMRPGKKGIALNIDQWNALKTQVDEIDEAIKKMA